MCRYQPRADSGFAEVALFPGLQSLRLGLDDGPDTLHLAESLSVLTALTCLELLRAFTARSYRPTFRAHASLSSCLHACPKGCPSQQACFLTRTLQVGCHFYQVAQSHIDAGMHAGGVVRHLPALEVLTVECSMVEQPPSSETLRCIELIGCGKERYMLVCLCISPALADCRATPRPSSLLHLRAYMHMSPNASAVLPKRCFVQSAVIRGCSVPLIQARPQLGLCAMLTRLRLQNMRPQSEEAYLEALSSCDALREVQLTFAYKFAADGEATDRFGRVYITSLVRQLLALPLLEASLRFVAMSDLGSPQ